MLDQALLPPVAARNFQMWVGPVTSAVVVNTGWYMWTKPKQASMVFMLCVGGGSGGGSANNTGAGTIRCGGGGGGSGGVARLIVPAMFLPTDLYILPGSGGIGQSGNGTDSGPSMVCDQPSNANASSRILLSGSSATSAAFGAGRGDTAQGSAGSGEGIAVNTGCAYAGFGAWKALAGQTGQASGGTGGAAGGSITLNAGSLVSGGAGGGSVAAANTAFAGGNITGAGRIPTLTGGAAPGGNGQPGFVRLVGWWGTGGSGGGSEASSGGGGAGGRGAPGCGGGGGGGGTGNGGGGDGGPGFVVIGWW